MPIIRILLLPFSFLYGLIVLVRNWLFDLGIFKSTVTATPCVIVGNLHVGGTGKTPHTISLAKHFQQHRKPAILSRGYGRSTKGFRYVTKNDRFDLVGDEALMFAKRTNATVAVSEKRVFGVNRLEHDHNPDLVILDDAFQHRHLKAWFSILLIPYHKPLHASYYLPSGELRDHRSQVKRADAIIISGCPTALNKASRYDFLRKEKYPEGIPVFFSEIVYGSFLGPIPSTKKVTIKPQSKLIVITGIAHPERLIHHLNNDFTIIKHLAYADHRVFTEKDVHVWKELQLAHPEAKIITTEKDAMRINALGEHISGLSIYYLPIEVKIDEAFKLFSLVESACWQPNNSKNLSKN